MALYGMADNNIAIPAKRDGAIYNAFARNSDFVIEGIGDEFAMTSSTTSFVLTLGTGEGIICGRHVTEVTEEGVNSVLQLDANSQGYVVIRMDLTRPAGSECYLTAVNVVTREDLNDTGTVADLVLYGYVTGENGVTSFVDMRNIRDASTVEAADALYSNGATGLQATTVQGAIDELASTITYNSVAQLGLTAGSATVPQAYSAMRNNSVLICPADQFATSAVPTRDASVFISKQSTSRGWAMCYEKGSSTGGDWRMYMGDNTGTLTGAWVAPWASKINFENTGAPTTATNVQNALWEALNGMPEYSYGSIISNYNTTIHLWKFGHIRFVAHIGTMNLPAANTVYTFATLPDWAKPGIQVFAPCLTVNNNAIRGQARFHFNTDGVVKVISSVAGNMEYHFYAVLIA